MVHDAWCMVHEGKAAVVCTLSGFVDLLLLVHSCVSFFAAWPGFTQLVCWAVVRAVLPFAAAATDSRTTTASGGSSGSATHDVGVGGGEVLQYAIEISYAGVTVSLGVNCSAAGGAGGSGGDMM